MRENKRLAAWGLCGFSDFLSTIFVKLKIFLSAKIRIFPRQLYTCCVTHFVYGAKISFSVYLSTFFCGPL